MKNLDRDIGICDADLIRPMCGLQVLPGNRVCILTRPMMKKGDFCLFFGSFLSALRTVTKGRIFPRVLRGHPH